MRTVHLLAALSAVPFLSGCVVSTVAKTAATAVTLPVKAAAKTYDLATTSQAEADQNRGRAMRKAEEAAGKRQRAWVEGCRKAQARGEQCPPAPEAPQIPN